MKTTALKEKGLMDTLLYIEKETILAQQTKIGTEQIPHWKSDEGVCGQARSKSNPLGLSCKEVSGHQRPY